VPICCRNDSVTPSNHRGNKRFISTQPFSSSQSVDMARYMVTARKSTGGKAPKASKPEAPKKPAAAPKVSKPAAPKKPAAHPPTGEMVLKALLTLKERNGSSVPAIKKYISTNFKVRSQHMDAALEPQHCPLH